MASQGFDPAAGNPRVPSFEGRSLSSLPEAPASVKDPTKVSGLVKASGSAEDAGCCLPRSVLSERERRKRISVSCEHLRALLPHFDGRREDMASVLEMAVQFLQLVNTLMPGWEQQPVPALSRETWPRWQEDVVQLMLASQVPDGKPDSGTAASSTTLQWDPSRCATPGVDESKALAGLSELLDGPPSLPEPSSLEPRPPSWSLSGQPASPAMSREVPGGPHQARATTSPGGLAEEAEGGLATPASDARPVSGADVEDEASFLLSTSPDWWLGSVEGGSGAAPSWAPARSSPVARAEPDLLADPEPSSQELQDGPLEPWGSDLGSWGPALRDEADSIFPDFFAC